eukprot:Nk52_evm1s174 gene=Nk52_evmTU1s174
MNYEDFVQAEANIASARGNRKGSTGAKQDQNKTSSSLKKHEKILQESFMAHIMPQINHYKAMRATGLPSGKSSAVEREETRPAYTSSPKSARLSQGEAAFGGTNDSNVAPLRVSSSGLPGTVNGTVGGEKSSRSSSFSGLGSPSLQTFPHIFDSLNFESPILEERKKGGHPASASMLNGQANSQQEGRQQQRQVASSNYQEDMRRLTLQSQLFQAAQFQAAQRRQQEQNEAQKQQMYLQGQQLFEQYQKQQQLEQQLENAKAEARRASVPTTSGLNLEIMKTINDADPKEKEEKKAKKGTKTPKALKAAAPRGVKRKSDSDEPAPPHLCKWKGCSEIFQEVSELSQHIASVHIGKGKREYKCEWENCKRNGRVFPILQQALRHAQTHTGEKPYVCVHPGCGQRFSQANVLATHTRVHTGEKPYKCKLCPRRFAHTNCLTAHMRSHTGERPHKCDVCGKRFAGLSNLTAHKRVHTGERPYICDFPDCDKKFSTSGDLTRHKRIHTGQKPYQCTFEGCKKKFITSGQMSCHMRIHTGEKPYVCQTPGCGKRYSDLTTLRRHLKHHGPEGVEAAREKRPSIDRATVPGGKEVLSAAEMAAQAARKARNTSAQRTSTPSALTDPLVIENPWATRFENL